MTRGDIVLTVVPYTDGSGAALRPAVVVSADRLNAWSDDVTVAPITTNTTRAGVLPTQVLIDVTTPDGIASRLMFTSVVRCEKATTLHKSLIRRVVGRMPPTLMAQIDAALKVALDLP